MGRVALPSSVSASAPAVLVFPEWWGVTGFLRDRARALAAHGYVAFTADMFGGGVTTDDPQEAMRLTGDTRFGAVSRARSRAALEWLATRPEVAGQIAAIGFCFGGDVALELARDGADLRGTVAFHASLGASAPAGPGDIPGGVLALHGADDPLVPPRRRRRRDRRRRVPRGRGTTGVGAQPRLPRRGARPRTRSKPADHGRANTRRSSASMRRIVGALRSPRGSSRSSL